MTDYIHLDPDRTLYSLTEEELNSIKENAQPLWKDICIACLFFGIPTIINAINETSSQEVFSITLSILLNYIFGVLGIVMAIAFGIAWHKCAKRQQDLISKIKSKPKVTISATTSDVGALPEVK